MNSFFTIIYIKTNRLSDEKIAIGLLANLNGLPQFYFATDKLSFALKSIPTNQSRAIKRSLLVLSEDVNKYVKGEVSIPMFDEPYALKLLKKLTLKKRGILIYGKLFSLENHIDYSVLYRKYISKNKPIESTSNRKSIETFKKRFNTYILGKRFGMFEKKKWISDTDFPLLTSPVQVDLFRQKSGLTVFKSIDFDLSERTIQQHVATFRMLVESLNSYASSHGLSKGRYYLVYESPKSDVKLKLATKIKSVYKSFELIKMSEMVDKI